MIAATGGPSTAGWIFPQTGRSKGERDVVAASQVALWKVMMMIITAIITVYDYVMIPSGSQTWQFF